MVIVTVRDLSLSQIQDLVESARRAFGDGVLIVF